jgi:alanyl-tRNA synthetase
MNLHRITESPVIEALNSVLQQRARVKESMALLQGYLDETLTPQTERIKREIQALEAQIKELTPAGNAAAVKQRTERLEQVRPDLDQADADKSRVQQALQRSDALIAALDEFNKQLTATPEGQQYSPLVSAALRKYVQQQEIAYLLYITISSSGGDSITSKERFARSGNLKFLGGCVISYILVDIAGQTVAADTVVKLSSLHYNLEQDDPPEFSS